MGRYYGNSRSSHLGICAAIGLAVVGCRNQQGQTANPFLSPDRVPPPATRMVAPGTAQPYYPGDPLPPMQGSAQPTGPTMLATTPDAPAPTLASVQPTEPPVQIQGDGPAGQIVQPIATAPSTGTVQQASFNDAQVEPIQVSVPESTEFVERASMWRSPEVPGQSVVQAQHTAPIASAAVPLQPMQPVNVPMQPVQQVQPMAPQYMTAPVSTAPRVRFPGYGQPVPIAALPQGGYAPPMYANGVPQTLRVTELPPYSYQPGIEPEPTLAIDPSAPQTFESTGQTPMTASPDGFRPRGSLR